MPIYTDKVTYGQSNTPSENHFIDGSTPNVLSIKRGTPLAPGAEVLKVNAGVVSFPNQVQTWQDVKTTPGRIAGTTYTNSTGQPIKLSIDFALASGVLFQAAITVAGITVANQALYGTSSSYIGNIQADVPTGATYSLTLASASLFGWKELR